MWDWWTVAGYFVFLFAWLGWELKGIRDYNDEWPAFTEVIRKYVPRWGRAILIGALTFWLVEHFLL